MSGTIRAADVYSILKAALGPPLKAGGFKASKIGPLAWSRPAGGEHLSFWFQCDRYGWMQDLGSRFTLEFQLGKDGNTLHNDLRKRERFAAFLSDDELEEARRLNNDVLDSLPPLSPGNPVNAIREDLRAALLGAYAPRREPYRREDDIWLHYYARAHVAAWAGFLERHTVALSMRFLDSRG